VGKKLIQGEGVDLAKTLMSREREDLRFPRNLFKVPAPTTESL
jgi:hypothetical protein